MIDVCVVVALLALVAGVLAPTMHEEMERSHRSNAQADVHRIAIAVSHYLSDMPTPPNRQGGQPIFFLHSAGRLPDDNPFARGEGASIDDFLVVGLEGDKNWKGPYLGQSPIDPWGRHYVVNVHGFDDEKERVWVLSAGENGVIETMPRDSSPGNDDIGMYIR